MSLVPVSSRLSASSRPVPRFLVPRFLVLSVAVLLLLVSGCVEQPGPDATGQEIYDQVCSRCHGPDLGGGVGPELGLGSELVDRTDEQIATTIRRGKGRMPSLGGTLTDEQIERLVGFLRDQQSP